MAGLITLRRIDINKQFLNWIRVILHVAAVFQKALRLTMRHRLACEFAPF
jgi:hypothetical protein